MNKQKEILIERMNNLKSLIPETIEAVGDLPDIGMLYTTLKPGELQIALDYKPSEYLPLRRTLAKRWKYIKHRFNEFTGNIYVYFNHRSLGVTLILELEIPVEFQDGTSCRLVEVGHKTEIIYGLECE